MNFIGKSCGFEKRFKPTNSMMFDLIRDDIKKRKPTFCQRPQDHLFEQAVRQTFRAFAIPNGVKLLHLYEVFSQDLPIWFESPGLPWILLGYRNKDKIRKDRDAINLVRRFWQRVKASEDVQMPDCCAGVDVYKENGERKTQAYWVYPATVTFGEAVFALPLIEAYKKGNYPVACDYKTDLDRKNLLQQFEGKNFLRVHFEDFDKTLPDWLITIAFDILADNLDFNCYQGYGKAPANSMKHMLNVIRNYFINTTIQICNGERYQKNCGLPIGSCFTQLIGSICNYLLLAYACLKLQANMQSILVLSDASIIGVDGQLTLADVANVLQSVGMVVNVDKSGHSAHLDRLSFLGKCDESVKATADALVWPDGYESLLKFASNL